MSDERTAAADARARLGDTFLAADRPVADREPLSDKLTAAYTLGWRDHEAGITPRPPRTLDAARAHPDEAGLREAVQAYVDWQYREKGASRFTLTALRAALAQPAVPVAGAEEYGDSTPDRHRSDTRGPCRACEHRAAARAAQPEKKREHDAG